MDSVFESIEYIAGGDIYHQFDLLIPSTASSHDKPLLVFIHGGAWRSEDKKDHRSLAHTLALLTSCPVAVPNYRLTITGDAPAGEIVRHPSHAQDLLHCLHFLLTWESPAPLGRVYDPHRMYLIGHSCSAHMLTCIFLDSVSVTPSLTPSPGLLHAVQAIIMSEGIYDIGLLLEQFPEYREWFIESTFGEAPSYDEYSTTKLASRSSTPGVRWLVIHSKGDTLVDIPQSDAMYNHLCSLYGESAATHVHHNFDQLDAQHNDILRGDIYPQIVANFILGDIRSASV